jgi:hypothetical protein
VDTGDSRTAASSCAAAASLASSFEPLAPGRFVTVATAFAACSGTARAAETVEVRFRAGVALWVDVFVAEDADVASVTFVVGCSEPLPVAFFPPVVFTIAIAFRLCLEIKPLKTFYYSTCVSALPLSLPLHSFSHSPSKRFISAHF